MQYLVIIQQVIYNQFFVGQSFLTGNTTSVREKSPKSRKIILFFGVSSLVIPCVNKVSRFYSNVLILTSILKRLLMNAHSREYHNDVTRTILTMSLQCFWALNCCLCRVLCDERRSYGFVTVCKNLWFAGQEPVLLLNPTAVKED